MANTPKNGSKGHSKPSIHTVPNPNGAGWLNKQDGKVLNRSFTKEAAVEKGRDAAKKDHTEHRIHNTDGRIGTCNSYGNDPNPPKDKDR
jgi:hypothetical protein